MRTDFAALGSWHNYLTLVSSALRTMPPTPGTVEIARVYHDEGCGFFSEGRCDCQPELVREIAR